MFWEVYLTVIIEVRNSRKSCLRDLKEDELTKGVSQIVRERE
jgi:hypothetical protein